MFLPLPLTTYFSVPFQVRHLGISALFCVGGGKLHCRGKLQLCEAGGKAAQETHSSFQSKALKLNKQP